MKKYSTHLMVGGAVLVSGALLSFFIFARTSSLASALMVGYFEAIIAACCLWLIHRFIASKLSVFNTAQQWLLKSFLYMLALTFSYLAGLILQMLILAPHHSIENSVLENFWNAFVWFISSPLSADGWQELVSGETRRILITFFALLSLIGIVSMIGSFIEIRWRQNRHHQVLQSSELQALRAQIEPHFLFNSLNTIAATIRSDPGKAERLLIRLSDLLRFSFRRGSENLISLKEELQFARNYVELLAERFGERLQVSWTQTEIDESFRVPVFLLQPLIENAIRHGWTDKETSFLLKISIEQDSAGVRIIVENNGEGIPGHTLKKLPIPGHALHNIAERLRMEFREKNLLQIESEPGRGVRVQIKIPEKI